MRQINNCNMADLKIDKTEVLKYLGYDSNLKISSKLDLICDECLEIIKKSSKPKFLYVYFDIKQESDGVLICKTPLLLKGQSLSRHLASCDKVAVFCVTLSQEVDKIIMQSKFDVLRQLFLDVTASVYIEQICERVCQIIKSENEKLFMTKRYGIGYGDLALAYQQDILSIINAQKRLGVMATAEGILTPRKSVTAIVGFSDKVTESAYQICDSCLLRNNCQYFMRGEHCGK